MTGTSTRESARNFAWLPGAAAGLAFLACNGLMALGAVLAIFGVTLVVNPHLQAAMIGAFSILALILVFLGYRRHRIRGPVILAGIGALVILATMYISYDKIVESIGLAALVASALWSWRATRQMPTTGNR